MKLVVKERFFGKRLDDLAIDYGSYSLPTIRSAAVRKSDDILRNDVLTEGLFQALGLKQSYDIDFVLDKLYFTALKVLVAKLEIPALDRFITEKIDLFNVSMIFQAISSGIPEGYVRRAFSEGGSLPYEDWERYLNKDRPDELLHFTLWQKYRPIWSGTRNRDQALAELDVRIDNYLIDKTKRCKLMAFGIEPICAYFFNKLMEIKNIRILLEGKAKSYDPAEIRKRMRIPYEI